MKQNKEKPIIRETIYINCGCQKNCVTQEQSEEHGNHKYPLSFYLSFSRQYDNLKKQIDTFLLESNTENLKVKLCQINKEQFEFEICFRNTQSFKPLVYEVLSNYILKPITNELHPSYMLVEGITPRTLLLDAHEAMHKYINKGLS